MADKIRIGNDDDYEPTDSDEEYSDDERKLLKKVRSARKYDSDSEQEVLGFDDDEDEYDDDDLDIEKFEHDSDIEDKNSDDGLPDSKAWGSKKRSYHGADFVDQDYDTYTAREEELAKQEEAEAKEIQQRLAKELDEADFSLDFFKPSGSEEQEKKIETTKLKSDLSDLSDRQKKALFRKEAPEFEGLVDDFTNNVEECSEVLEPVIKFLKSKNIEKSPIVEFIKLKHDLAMSYCNNITFYLLLKAKRIPVKNHPVVKRLVQIKQLLTKLDERYQNIVRPQLVRLLEAIEAGEEIVFEDEAEMDEDVEIPVKKSKKLNLLKNLEAIGSESDAEDEQSEEEDVEEPDTKRARIDSDDENEEQTEQPELEDDSQFEEEAGKRGITYQIAKNKGLTVHKKKEQRNVRVKNKQKYKKALIRRKGTVRDVRPQTMRYGGESSGIKAFVKRSIKIK